jgi:hypothetical protein
MGRRNTRLLCPGAAPVTVLPLLILMCDTNRIVGLVSPHRLTNETSRALDNTVGLTLGSIE